MIAKQLGVNRETVGRWESGKRYPEIAMFSKIYEMLGEDALPLTGDDLSGEMKFFRMKTGLRMKEAAHLVKKGKYWWAQMEKGVGNPDCKEQQILKKVLGNEEDSKPSLTSC